MCGSPQPVSCRTQAGAGVDAGSGRPRRPRDQNTSLGATKAPHAARSRYGQRRRRVAGPSVDAGSKLDASAQSLDDLEANLGASPELRADIETCFAQLTPFSRSGSGAERRPRLRQREQHADLGGARRARGAAKALEITLSWLLQSPNFLPR